MAKKIKSFDKQNLKELREEIADALKKIEQKFGIEFTQGSISYTSDSFNMKLMANVGIVDKKDVNEIDTKELIGKYFEIPGKRGYFKVLSVYNRKPGHVLCSNTRNDKEWIIPIKDAYEWSQRCNQQFAAAHEPRDFGWDPNKK